MFETTGEINDKILEKFKKYLIPSFSKNILIFIIPCSLILGLIDLFFNRLLLALIFFLGTIIFIAEYIFIINRNQKLSMQRIEETFDKKEISYEISFDEEGMLITNLDTRAQNHIKYSSFTKIIKISNTYGFFTNAMQFIFIYDDFSGSENTTNFENFIKEKCKNLKKYLV